MHVIADRRLLRMLETNQATVFTSVTSTFAVRNQRHHASCHKRADFLSDYNYTTDKKCRV